MARIEWIEVQGFRSFGVSSQRLSFDGSLALVWGANSQGKTSLAECFEFLLTGRTVRREFVASAKREFAGALRNVNLPAPDTVSVRAGILDTAGDSHVVERVLVSDYSAQDCCTSKLTVDGKEVADLEALGIYLSSPPLEAPVLMQHTLRYVVSARPQERADYFKALLEISDLEAVRDAIVEARKSLTIPDHPLYAKLQACAQAPIGDSLNAILECIPTPDELDKAIGEALTAVCPEVHGKSLPEQTAHVEQILTDKRQATFPFHGFNSSTEQPALTVSMGMWEDLTKHAEVVTGVDQTIARLTELYNALLSLPEVASASGAIDCPVCQTPEGLTLHRIEEIKEELKTTAEFRQGLQKSRRALISLDTAAGVVDSDLGAAMPRFTGWREEEKTAAGFTVDAMEALLGDDMTDQIEDWRESTTSLERSVDAARSAAAALRTALKQLDLDRLRLSDVENLKSGVDKLVAAISAGSRARAEYLKAEEKLRTSLERIADTRADTIGWPELIDLANRRSELTDHLANRRAIHGVCGDVVAAVAQIDAAKGELLDNKFTDLSAAVARWWALLRPNESVTFEGVRRAGTGRRFVDLKAGVEPSTGSQLTLRDAVAVFSDSQLNCLGLAAFLARSVRQDTGFIVLDDPVPASDDEHQAMFIRHVVEALLAEGLQVILLTHDQSLWRDVQERYSHLEMDTFIVTLPDQTGSVVQSKSDDIDALLARANSYIENPDPEIRALGATSLRKAAERFCKGIVVNERRRKGQPCELSNLDGKSLGDLVPDVLPLLTDPADVGKLRTIGRNVGPGAHDDAVPGISELKVSAGDLRYLRKKYHRPIRPQVRA